MHSSRFAANSWASSFLLALDRVSSKLRGTQPDSVMVTQQILILLFQVRVLVGLLPQSLQRAGEGLPPVLRLTHSRAVAVILVAAIRQFRVVRIDMVL